MFVTTDRLPCGVLAAIVDDGSCVTQVISDRVPLPRVAEAMTDLLHHPDSGLSLAV